MWFRRIFMTQPEPKERFPIQGDPSSALSPLLRPSTPASSRARVQKTPPAFTALLQKPPSSSQGPGSLLNVIDFEGWKQKDAGLPPPGFPARLVPMPQRGGGCEEGGRLGQELRPGVPGSALRRGETLLKHHLEGKIGLRGGRHRSSVPQPPASQPPLRL